MTEPNQGLLPEDRLMATFTGSLAKRPTGHALEDGVTVLIGPGDSGKAAALWHSAQHSGACRFFHHAGLGGETGNPDRFLWRLLNAIRNTCGFHDPVPDSVEVMREALPNWLARAAAGGRFCIAVADGQELTRGGLEPDLEWIPNWLPAGVSILVSVRPGPAAELYRDRADHAIQQSGSGQSDLRQRGRELLRDEAAREVAEWLWASRAGLSVSQLEQLVGGPVDDALATLEPLILRAGDQVALAGATARELAAAGGLADHGARQKRHMALAEFHETEQNPASRVLALWHHAQSGRGDALLAGLLARDWLALCQQAWARQEALALWRRFGDQQFLVDQMATQFQEQAFESEALNGVIALVEAASGQTIPLDWLQAGLTAAIGNQAVEVQAGILERMAIHPDHDKDQALRLLSEALSLREQQHGPGDRRTESVRHRLACVHEERDDLDTAAQTYQAGLQALEKQHGGNDVQLVPWLINLGAVFKAAGQLKQAAELMGRALKLSREQLGARHPTTAGCLDQMANIYYLSAQYGEAEPLYREALEITEASFGPEHAATAACLNNLATVLDARQLFKEAEQLYRQSLAVRQALHGEHHSDTASTMHNLATVLESAGKGEEAEQLFRRALDAWDKVSGSESPAFATTLLSLADLLRDRGAWADAEALYRSDVEIWRQLVGPDHPHTLTALAGLAQLYVEGGKAELAEPLLAHVLETADRIVGKTDSLYMDTCAVLAALLRDSGRPDQARQVLESALAAHGENLSVLSAPVQKLKRLVESLDQQQPNIH